MPGRQEEGSRVNELVGEFAQLYQGRPGIVSSHWQVRLDIF